MTKSIKMSQDKFLGGKLAIRQIQGGYRAGSDPVLLAASLSLQPGQTLLDMGCGVGTAFLCALVREKSLRVTGIEIQKEIAELAKRNSIDNNFETEIYNLDIRDIKIAVGQKQFDHVIFNPPFFDINQGTISKTTDRLLSKFALTLISTKNLLKSKKFFVLEALNIILYLELKSKLQFAFDIFL